MKFTRQQQAILYFTSLYLVIFGWRFVVDFNVEFIAYVGLIIGLLILIFSTLYITRFPTYLLWCVSIWGLLHMMGGGVMVGDDVLYAWKIYPFFDGGGEFYILKFDQVVHAALYGVVALMFLHLLKQVYGLTKYEPLTIFIALMAALGVSAVNEILEFIAVLTVPDNGVGGYYNTLLDIIFNFGGACVGVSGYYLIKKLKSTAWAFVF